MIEIFSFISCLCDSIWFYSKWDDTTQWSFHGMKILFYIDRSVQSAQTRASSSFLYLVSFFCMQIIRHLPTYLPIYVALRVLSLFSRKIPPGNKIACNIIPDSPVSPSASPFHPFAKFLRETSIHSFPSPHPLLSVWSTRCIFDALPSTDNGPCFSSSSVFRGWWNIRQGSLRVGINVWKNYDARWEREKVVFF